MTMKKTKIIAMLLAAVMLLSMIPMTASAADVRHPIVKDVVEFDGQYAATDNYFALGSSLYDSEGNRIFTLGADDETIYTLTDHCMITLCSNIGNFNDLDFLEGLEDIEDLEEFLKDVEIGFNVYSLNGNEVLLKSSFDNYPCVLPFDGYSHTAVLHLDIITLLVGIFSGETTEADVYDLIYGYDIIDEYGNVVYSENGQKIAQPVGDGIFVKTWISSEGEVQDLLTVTDDGIEEIYIGNEYVYVEGTELGHFFVMTEDYKGGVMNSSGDLLVMDEFDEIIVSDEYYIAYERNEDTYEFERSLVFGTNGKCVWTYDSAVTYYNGKVAVVETYDTTEIDSEEFEYITNNLIDVKTGDVITDGEYIYYAGGYILAEYSTLYPDGTAIYTTDGKLITGDKGYVTCVDEGNSTIIVDDSYNEKVYRINSNAEIVETFPSYDVYCKSSYNNVSVFTEYSITDDEYDYESLVALMYKGEKISDDHISHLESFAVNGCEVHVFFDYDPETYESIYVAYIIDGDKSPFYDIREDHWAREYIDTCYEAGIMNGTGGGKFSPSGAVSRAQVVTTLWRLAGEPDAKGGTNGMVFTDVAGGQWYTEAVAWAAENGITAGVGGSSFAPDRTVTRGEVAAILYRYASYAGEDVSGRADLNTFADTGALSDWNRDAFAWCVEGGIINGKAAGSASQLAPSDTLTRAELAAVLYRYGI